jgi:hypothetical protein
VVPHPRPLGRAAVTAKRKKPTRRAQHAKLRRDASKHYDAMLAAQNGHCALCPNEPKGRRLHIDHDHRTMRVRALLCFRCNSALRGYMTPGWLRAAADYLELHANDPPSEDLRAA